MAGGKMGAIAGEEIVYLEKMLRQCDGLHRQIEEYASAKKNADSYSTAIARELQRIRQVAMMKNLGFVADAAGGLGMQASRGGSPTMKARALREGIVSFRALIERTIKSIGQKDATDMAEKKDLMTAVIAEEHAKKDKAAADAAGSGH
jgi:hypothetical protein